MRYRFPLGSIQEILNFAKHKQIQIQGKISNYRATPMENITDIKIGPMPESVFLKPLRMTFLQNGKKRFWDFIKTHQSVSIIIYNPKREVMVFVKQFRPAVFYNNAIKKTGDNEVQEVDLSNAPRDFGITIELCAGIVDAPGKTLVEIAKQEVLEECGYDVPLEKFEKVLAHRSGVGSTGDIATVFYVEISDEMRVNSGGGLAEEGEFIDVVEMTIPEVRKYMTQENVQSPGGLLFAMYWFIANKFNSK